MAEETGRPIRLLTFTTLFPHRGSPNHGVFVENRLRHLLATGQATSTVLAPVGWFPSTAKRFGVWAEYARAERSSVRDGVASHRPRYVLPPWIGMQTVPFTMFVSSALALRRLVRAGLAFDVIDAHYLYPDGVAAVLLGRLFRKPVVITVRGSDVTQYPGFAIPGRLIRWAMHAADALISVSGGLKDALVALGASPESVTVLRNGVDLGLFQPGDRAACRAAFGLVQPTLLSVGHLIDRKGHHLTIEALAGLPGWRLLIAGEGPERGRLMALTRRLGLADRVEFLGSLPHAELPRLYTAADILVLASRREGWANVLLESMACGTPVVASDIPGSAEVIQSQAAGRIVASNTAEGFREAIEGLSAALPSRAETRAYAEGFSWDATSAGQLAVFRRVLHGEDRTCPAS